MVDALSQCVTLLSTIHTHMPGFDTLCELYLADALFNQIYVELLEGGKQEKYVLLNCYFFSWFTALYSSLFFTRTYHS